MTKMDWREFWTIITGLEPPAHYLPGIVSVLILFFVILVICFVMHRLCEIFMPNVLQVYALDFVKTMAVCTYPFGIIILRKYYSDLVFLLCVVPLNTVTVSLLRRGEASPIGNWLHMVRGRQSPLKSIGRIVVQMIAGSAGFRLGKLLMNLDLHEDFGVKLRQTECFTALKVSVALGIVLELIGTAWITWFNLQDISYNTRFDKLAKIINTAMAVWIGMKYIGIFMHPAKAFGMTFGCHGISNIDHILVYCIGPMIGSYLALKIDSRWKEKAE